MLTVRYSETNCDGAGLAGQPHAAAIFVGRLVRRRSPRAGLPLKRLAVPCMYAEEQYTFPPNAHLLFEHTRANVM